MTWAWRLNSWFGRHSWPRHQPDQRVSARSPRGSVCLAPAGLKGEGTQRKAAHVLQQGKARIKALRDRPGRTEGRLATCISTDSVMLCRHRGAAGLYGNPQERKGPGSRRGRGGGGGGLGRDRALPARALPEAPAGAWAR